MVFGVGVWPFAMGGGAFIKKRAFGGWGGGG